MMGKGTLYLVPNYLGNEDPGLIPEQVKAIVKQIDTWIVEHEKAARRLIKSIDKDIDLDKVVMHRLDKNTDSLELETFLNTLDEGKDVGLISEAGLPAVADPGANIISLAHEKGIKVMPLTGPSSIFLALMASGLNGQNFAFSGYLPKHQSERIKKLKELEQLSRQYNQTQIFMETPYRNHHLLEDILKVGKENTRLCLASNLTLEDEFIQTRTIKEWRNQKVDIQKKPTMFLIQAG